MSRIVLPFLTFLCFVQGFYLDNYRSLFNLRRILMKAGSDSTKNFVYRDFKNFGANSIFLWKNGQEYDRGGVSRLGFQYTIYCHEVNEEDNQARLQRLMERLQSSQDNILKRPSTDLEAGRYSHFLSLTYPDLYEAVPDLEEIRKGIDAFELRVDLLRDQSPLNIHRQIAVLRSHFPFIPIIYTVRTQNQLGKYPDNDYTGIESLLLEGVRAGVDWLDIEANLPEALVNRVLQAATASPLTRIIGSYHTTASELSEKQLEEYFTLCNLLGQADIVKVVTGASSKEDCLRIHKVGRRLGKPYIGLCLGEIGSYSRVLNERYTPVTHEAMKVAAAPGQLTVEELQKRRLQEGLIPQKQQYYLFGSPIQQSLSPLLHNHAYQTLHIPTSIYSLQESQNVEDYEEIFRIQEDFCGASVTIPHKETIIPYLDHLSDEAIAIGAVNTIVVTEKMDNLQQKKVRQLIGYNTDWLGMYKPIARLLLRKQAAIDKSTEGIGIVIGAGGTARAACYVIERLGLKLLIANRHLEKAQALAKKFDGQVIALEALDTLSNKGLKVIISTIPASAAFTLPSHLLECQPIVLDVVYRPAMTPLLTQAKNHDCLFIQGASMLFEQAIEQFQLWNHRLAPYQEMKQELFQEIGKEDSV